jgi:leucyl aminopeptidase
MKKKVEWKISDLKNISSDMKAWSSMGWAFLTHFIEKTPYTHIDIAGVAYRDSPQGIYSSGATGFGTLSLSGLLWVWPYQS